MKHYDVEHDSDYLSHTGALEILKLDESFIEPLANPQAPIVRSEFPETWMFISIFDGDWIVVNESSRFVFRSLNIFFYAIISILYVFCGDYFCISLRFRRKKIKFVALFLW